MNMKTMLKGLMAAAMVVGFTAVASAEGLISIIVNDPANPADGKTAG
jgi:erythritol transport system substrate-binding protein